MRLKVSSDIFSRLCAPMRRLLMQSPKVFLLCLTWPSGECTRAQTAACMNLMGRMFDMRQLFKLGEQLMAMCC